LRCSLEKSRRKSRKGKGSGFTHERVNKGKAMVYGKLIGWTLNVDVAAFAEALPQCTLSGTENAEVNWSRIQRTNER
jgi:hypothetical protein